MRKKLFGVGLGVKIRSSLIRYVEFKVPIEYPGGDT